MAFEMSLPHTKRIKQIEASGEEKYATDEDLWNLHTLVQSVIKNQRDCSSVSAVPERCTTKAEAPNPQRVLENLLTARGEVDVILDLINYVEQQQFIGMAHLPRKASTVEDLTRERALRLSHRRHQLKAASQRLASGLEELRTHQEVSNKFTAQVAELRKRWKVNRHGGRDGLFYVDLSLPLTMAARKVVGDMAGATCNLLQDTTGDVCMVDKNPDGSPEAVRGWQAIHALLQEKQHALTWRAIHRIICHEGEHAQAHADPHGLTPVLLQLVASGEECRGAVGARDPKFGSSDAAGSASAGPGNMEVDHTPFQGPPGHEHPGASVPAPGNMEVDCTPFQGPPGHEYPGASVPVPGSVWESSVWSGLPAEISASFQKLVRSPGFYTEFLAEALEGCRMYLRDSCVERSRQQPGHGALSLQGRAGESLQPPWLNSRARSLYQHMLGWLQHCVTCQQVQASLHALVSAGLMDVDASGSASTWMSDLRSLEGMSLACQQLPCSSSGVSMWQLTSRDWSAPAFVVVCNGIVRVEMPFNNPS